MNELADLLGESPTIQAVREKLRRLLDRQRAGQRLPPILVQGETGTGKGLVARMLHRHGPRSHAAFVDVNCPAIPETLLEAELFGYERGAFTDARHAKPGLFQAAHGGVLFLDEVGLLPESLQAKLLTAIEERRVRRLGSTRSEPADAWLISATNADLQAAVHARHFRADLYHRLAVVTLELPPLRERGSDILLLAKWFLARACAEYGLSPMHLDPGAEARLLAHTWPGNIREVANVIERAALFADTPVVTADGLGPLQAEGDWAADPEPREERATRRDEAQRQQLLTALEHTGWNISLTAARLGIARNTVYARLQKLGLRPSVQSKAAGGSPRGVDLVAAPAAEGAGLRWEWRSITLLRADLGSAETVGSWSQASRALDAVAAKVHSFGGRVEDVTPTGLVAAFGLDPDEHAPRRAAHAALAIHKGVERPGMGNGGRLTVTIGLHVTPLLIGVVGARIEIDSASKRAQEPIFDRLLQAAPGETVVSGAAAPFLERRFELAPIDAAGNGPGLAYRLTGQEGRGFGLWGAMTKFVGRRNELELLQHRLSLARAGQGQVVAVVGEAGVGKSRLVYELTTMQPREAWRLLEGTAAPYGQAMSYLPAIDLLKGYFGIEERDDSRGIREKVTGKLLTLDRALEFVLPALLALLGVPVEDAEWRGLEPSQRRQRTMDGIKHMLLREAQRQPVLLVFEDLHLIDTETQALLDTLVESVPTAPLLLLVNYRPEYRHPWGDRAYYSQLGLEPLPPENADELLEGLLGTDPSVEPLKDLLAGKTGRNPLFLEEGVRTLAETRVLQGVRGAYRLVQPVDTIQVPATVQAILAARMDRLTPEDRWLLEAAAAIGTDVPLALLQAVADENAETMREPLRRLQAAELLHETRLPSDLEYAFKHALTHEVAYGKLLPERRRELHARIVAAIEALHRDHLDGEIERLAHHAVRGELREKAVSYLRQAGLKATARSALPDAVDWFEQALGVLEALPESRSTLEQGFEIRVELRLALGLLGEARRVVERLREAEMLAERLNDDRRRGQVWAFMANLQSRVGEPEAALVSGTRALTIARSLGDVRLGGLATTYLEQAHFIRGEYERVVELATDNIGARPADWTWEYFGVAAPVSVADRCWLMMSLAQLGRFAEAAVYEAEVMELVERAHRALPGAHAAATVLHIVKGDWVKARSAIERWIGVVRTGNIALHLPLAVASSAWVLAQLNETGEALICLREGEQLLEGQAARRGRYGGWDVLVLGRAFLALGRAEDARNLADRAVDLSRHHPGYAPHALHLLGDIAARPDDFDAASGEAHYRQALALAERRSMRPVVAHCHLGLGRLYQRTGKGQDAQDHLAIATTMYREMDMRFWLEKAEMRETS